MAEAEPPTFGPKFGSQLLAEALVLELPAVELLLVGAAHAAATGVGLSCGITCAAQYGFLTVASSDERAAAVDEIQYGIGDGPSLRALHSAEPVRVDDLLTDTRWGGYRHLALTAGVRSSLSLPVMIDSEVVGAVNVYSTAVGPLPSAEEAAALAAGNQVAGVLHYVRLFASKLLRDPEAARTVRDRHDRDIALGIVMSLHGCDEAEARNRLAEQAAVEGRALVDVVARLIAASGID